VVSPCRSVSAVEAAFSHGKGCVGVAAVPRMVREMLLRSSTPAAANAAASRLQHRARRFRGSPRADACGRRAEVYRAQVKGTGRAYPRPRLPENNRLFRRFKCFEIVFIFV